MACWRRAVPGLRRRRRRWRRRRRLFQAGHDVTLVARGEHAEAIRAHGLRLESPEGAETLPIPVVEVADLESSDPVVALLAVKSQDTAAAVRDLADSRRWSRRSCACRTVSTTSGSRCAASTDVYGVCVMLPGGASGARCRHRSRLAGRRASSTSAATRPASTSAPPRSPRARGATFLSEPRPDIMRWKYRKLVMNLGNAVQALVRPVDDGDPVIALVEQRGGGRASRRPGSTSSPSRRTGRAGRTTSSGVRSAGGPRTGGSSYQSLERRPGDHRDGLPQRRDLPARSAVRRPDPGQRRRPAAGQPGRPRAVGARTPGARRAARPLWKPP